MHSGKGYLLNSLPLSVTSEEYKLLHRLNQVTIAKYQDMTALAGRLNEVSQRLNDKCKLIHNFSRPSGIIYWYAVTLLFWKL
jgi:hypothetical protein